MRLTVNMRLITRLYGSYMCMDKALKSDKGLCWMCLFSVCSKNDVTYSCCMYLYIYIKVHATIRDIINFLQHTWYIYIYIYIYMYVCICISLSECSEVFKYTVLHDHRIAEQAAINSST